MVQVVRFVNEAGENFPALVQQVHSQWCITLVYVRPSDGRVMTRTSVNHRSTRLVTQEVPNGVSKRTRQAQTLITQVRTPGAYWTE